MSKSHEGRVERLVPQHISYPEQLPVVARKNEIMRAIAKNQVVVIAGETGSGKTTQLPKMCLELEAHFRQLGGLTGPCLTGNHDNLILGDSAHDFVFARNNRQLLGV